MSLILIFRFLMPLDWSLGKKGSLSFPWQACRLLLVLFNSPKWHGFLFLALRLEPNEMPLTNIPSRFPARADAGSFMPLDFRRLIGISRPPDSSGIKSHFSNLSIWGRTRGKKVEVNELRRGTAKWRGRTEKVVSGREWCGGAKVKKTDSWHGVNPSNVQAAFTPEPLRFVSKQMICSICMFPSSRFLFTAQ